MWYEMWGSCIHICLRFGWKLVKSCNCLKMKLSLLLWMNVSQSKCCCQYLEFILKSLDVLSSGKNFWSSFLLLHLLCLGLRGMDPIINDTIYLRGLEAKLHVTDGASWKIWPKLFKLVVRNPSQSSQIWTIPIFRFGLLSHIWCFSALV